jgi:hypothetical protein
MKLSIKGEQIGEHNQVLGSSYHKFHNITYIEIEIDLNKRS